MYRWDFCFYRNTILAVSFTDCLIWEKNTMQIVYNRNKILASLIIFSCCIFHCPVLKAISENNCCFKSLQKSHDQTFPLSIVHCTIYFHTGAGSKATFIHTLNQMEFLKTKLCFNYKIKHSALVLYHCFVIARAMNCKWKIFFWNEDVCNLLIQLYLLEKSDIIALR